MNGSMCVFDCMALVLVIIGGLNWGLVGFFDFDLVHFVFGAHHLLTKIVYILVGVAALWSIVVLSKIKCKK